MFAMAQSQTGPSLTAWGQFLLVLDIRPAGCNVSTLRSQSGAQVRRREQTLIPGILAAIAKQERGSGPIKAVEGIENAL